MPEHRPLLVHAGKLYVETVRTEEKSDAVLLQSAEGILHQLKHLFDGFVRYEAIDIRDHENHKDLTIEHPFEELALRARTQIQRCINLLSTFDAPEYSEAPLDENLLQPAVQIQVV